ncbi:MAG: outer membrane beta-barrel family protein, partial [Muribaculaceae bacterium]
STLWAGKLYLKFPLGKGDFTIGTQDSYTHTSLDYRMLNSSVSEYIPSSLTDARQTSAAMFASWSRMFGKFSLSAGARYEYVDYDFKVDGKRDEEVSRRDHLLTPDLSLGYSFDQESQISLSYKMVTVKPPYSQLTGSLSYTGLHEIEGGNPALHDEKMHDLQFFGMWHGFMLQADYTRSLDAYGFVKQLYPTDNLQLLMHPVNIDRTALNLYLMWSKPIRCWTPNVTIGMYQQWLTLDNTKHNKPIFAYYFDNTFAFPYGWNITANFRGQTEGDMSTNRLGSTAFAMDASVGKTFLNKSLTVKLSATDIFNTSNKDWTMNTYGVRVDKRQSYDSRSISLNVIYNFQPRKSKYKGASAAEDEMRRL